MSVRLTDPQLGELDLGPIDLGAGVTACNPLGYVVTGWEIGFPAERPVARNRALGNGTIDSTRFLGSRAVSLAVVIDVNKQDPQYAIDSLTAYMTPNRRPRLSWCIPGSTQERSLLVRGVDAPVSIAGRQAHVVSASFVGVNGVLESSNGDGPGGVNTATISPGSDTEAGRTYDLDFDRSYPPTAGIGSRIVRNLGNQTADWTATIFGPSVDPMLTINGVDLAFTRNGGLTLIGGESVTVSTLNRTVLLNDDPTESRYDRVNFTEWAWDDVRLKPGDNTFRYEEASLDGTVEVSWRSAWL